MSEQYSPFDNASGVFPEFDAAAPRGSRSIVLQAVQRALGINPMTAPINALMHITTDPKTGERYQLWPEKLARSAATLPGDVWSGAVPAGRDVIGMRREDYTDIPAGGGEREGGIPGLRSLFNPALDAQRDNPAETLMERAQDLAGVLGGGPLTSRPSAATLASGAKLPRDIGGAGMTRRGLLDMFQAREAPVETKIEAAPAPQLPAVQDPLARLIGGGEAPRSALLDKLTAKPKTTAANPAERLMSRARELSATLNPEVDRRAVLRGIGATVANAGRVGQIAESLMKPAETIAAAPKIELPKFEEIWKRFDEEGQIPEHVLNEASDRAWEATAAAFNKRPGMKQLYRKNNDAWQEKFEDWINSEEGIKVNDKHTERALEKIDYDFEPQTNYHDYQLPGGENYRELLLKMPESDRAARLQELVDGGWSKERAEAHIKEEGGGYNAEPTYHSGTWDEPDVLGHLRMHDRDIPGVGKALHLEELNSEWHQQGLKHGYQGDKTLSPHDKALARVQSEFETNWVGKPIKASGRVPTKWDPQFLESTEGRKLYDKFIRQETGKESVGDVFESGGGNKVPDAPLKNEWPDFLLRRAIKEAVESGHDAVSWTPGEHQLDRYHTTKLFEDKGVFNERENLFKQRAELFDKLGGEAGAGKTPKNKQIEKHPEYAELTRRIDDLSEELDLHAGKKTTAAGQKAQLGVSDFYDKHLVDRANEIGKAYGAKVEKHSLRNAPTDETAAKVAEYRRRYKMIDDKYRDTPGYPGTAVRSPEAIALREEFNAKELMRKAPVEHDVNTVPRTDVPVLKITPALRKAVKDGSFTLLSDAGKPGAPLAALEHAQPFFSAAERAVQSAKMDKGSSEQWLGYLRNQPGVRKEELEHLGLEGKLQGKQLSKEQVAVAVKEGQPQIKEVWKKGDTFDERSIQDIVEHTAEMELDRFTEEHNRNPTDAEYRQIVRRVEEEVRANPHEYDPDSITARSGGPKFSDPAYSLPGGENYREMLLTPPEKELKHGVDPKTNKMTIEGQGQNYVSSHWDEPNVLAHARMNDRHITNPDFTTGKSDQPALKSLHLEELQSDWHQRGRKEGYKEPVKPVDTKGWTVETKKNNNFTGQRDIVVRDAHGNQLSQRSGFYGTDEQAIADQAGRRAERSNEGKVPDAPFKQTWPDLLLKRLVHEAAAKGYDSISWTPGDAQAARYDLSKHIDALHWRKRDDGHYQIAFQRKGSDYAEPQLVSKGKLADAVGKDLADKIDANEGKSGEYRGLDLKVGGEGMRAFYDKMLVDKANALGKRHGAKVEQKEQPHDYEILEPTKAHSEYRVDSVDQMLPSQGFKIRAEAERWIKEHAPRLHVLRITPELRKVVLKDGFPLFSAALPFGALDEGVKRK